MPIAMSEVATPLPPPQIHPCRSLLHSPWNCRENSPGGGARPPSDVWTRGDTRCVTSCGWVVGTLVGRGAWGARGVRELGQGWSQGGGILLLRELARAHLAARARPHLGLDGRRLQSELCFPAHFGLCLR